MQAAEAAECARAQNRFGAMHDLLIANQDHLELQYIYGYAEDLGLALQPHRRIDLSHCAVAYGGSR